MTKRIELLHEHALDMLEEADLALARIPDLPIDGVHSEAQITPAWLGEVLATDVPEAKLEQAENTEGHDGMTNRRRWRLEWNAAGRSAGLAERIFVKVTPNEPYLRETLSLLHMAEHEVRFYDQLQPELTTIAPKGFYGKYYPGGRFILITEDLEATGNRPFWLHDLCSVEHAREVLTTLAMLHSQYWESERFATDLGWVRPRLQKFGRKWHRGSYEIARAKYPATDMAADMPDEIRAVLDLWSRDYMRIYKYWATLPQTVLHGDSHFGNTYATPEGRAGYFDWQVIFRGHGLRDVSYFLGSALSNDVRVEHESDLLTHYFDQLAMNGIEMDRARGLRDYHLLCLERFDAMMKTHVFGGYGHQLEARIRGRDAVFGSIIDNNVLDLMRCVLEKGDLS